MDRYDVAIVGGGILGLATALALTDLRPGLNVVVLEKEPDIARHQTGRNSGVIHSGLYYRPGSLKARLCVAGAERLVAFCDRHGVAYRRDGKLVVATTSGEVAALAELERRGNANGLTGLRRLGAGELAEVEPHVRGVAGLVVPTSGAVDFADVARAMTAALERRGVELRTSSPLEAVAVGRDLILQCRDDAVRAGYMVNCAGLWADRVARLCGVEPDVRIVPFRGEYYDVAGPSADLVRASIYPVPDPDLPFLGVHLTRTVAGQVHAGPNAVLALAREGYDWTTVRPGELWDAISYPGTLRLARRHWKVAAVELARSASKERFARSVRRLVPDIADADLQRGRSGVRAQALGRRGELLDDFHIIRSRSAAHVLNAPSPAATASLTIAGHIVDAIAEELPGG